MNAISKQKGAGALVWVKPVKIFHNQTNAPINYVMHEKNQEQVANLPEAKKLFLVFDLGQQHLKVGTCRHCVVGEPVRPTRAWDAEGDKALDFDREALMTGLAAYGIQLTLRDQYICT